MVAGQVAATLVYSSSSSLDNVKTGVDIASGLATAFALIIGGIWTYFRFIKDRTYRPRLEVQTAGEWLTIGSDRKLLLRIAVKNIGATKVTLLQYGTGVRVSVPDSDQPAPASDTHWSKLGTFSLLQKHDWIEPMETVSDDLLLALAVTADSPVLVEVRLVWSWRGDEGNIVVSSRRILAAAAKLASASSNTT